MIQAAAFVMPDQPHYLDHIGIVSILMQIPLLCLEDIDIKLGKKYYPGIEVEKVDYFTFSREYLFKNYDLIFTTDLWDRDTFRREHGDLIAKVQKPFRVVHCPHGFSDKGFYLAKCAKEDVTLVYGQNMLDQLADEGVLNQMQDFVISGNYRYTYYKMHQAFYDQIVQEEVLSQFPSQQPTILYAPTWADLEKSTTFFEGAHQIFDALPDCYNMIVKLHPRLADQGETVGDYYRILGEYEGKTNMVFIREYPAIYSLLAHTDIYLGDLSSIGYDFLPLNKPMYFLHKHQNLRERERRYYLFQCGVEVDPEDYSNLFSIIEKTLPEDQARFSKIRQEVNAYTFGEELTFEALRKNICNVVLPSTK